MGGATAQAWHSGKAAGALCQPRPGDFGSQHRAQLFRGHLYGSMFDDPESNSFFDI